MAMSTMFELNRQDKNQATKPKVQDKPFFGSSTPFFQPQIQRQPSEESEETECQQQQLYVKVHVTNRSTFGYGWLVIHDSPTSEEVFRMPIGARGTSRDTTKKNADLPLGRYKVPNTTGERWKNGGDRMAYGPNDRMVLEPDFPTTRTDIRIHGGRQEISPGIKKEKPTLNITHGCMRALDANMLDLKTILNDNVYVPYLDVIQDLVLDAGSSDPQNEALNGSGQYFIADDLAKLNILRNDLRDLLAQGFEPYSEEALIGYSAIFEFIYQKGLDPADAKFGHKGQKN